jgi:two-component system, cell cycle response regulator
MAEALKVGLIGLTEKNITKLEEIFQGSRDAKRTYSISGAAEESDLFIVGVNDADSFDRRCVIPDLSAHKPVVTQGMKDKPHGSDYHIKGLLLASRVITVLDQIEIQKKEEASLMMAQQDGAANHAANSVYRVLVVDDSEIMRKTLAIELERATLPLAVDFAESGEQALQKAAGEYYDFMFMDVMMPGIDGYETCSRIRAMPGKAKIPIIMLSGKTSPLDEVKGIMAGCSSYLTKPIRSEEFQKMLERVMNWLANYRK